MANDMGEGCEIMGKGPVVMCVWLSVISQLGSHMLPLLYLFTCVQYSCIYTGAQ